MSEQFNKYYNVRIKLRTGSWTEWMTEGSDFIPYNGEAIIYERPTNNEKTAYNIKNIDY